MKVPSNQISELYRFYQKRLSGFYPDQEAKSLLLKLIWHYFGISRMSMAVDPGYRLNESELLQLHFAVEELEKFRPIQYVLGFEMFGDLRFEVDSNVLIPRPETLQLVSVLTEFLSSKKFPRLLDIGTGSGCIAISLAKSIPEAEVFALDISTEALQCARRNADAHQMKIHFIEADILEMPEAVLSDQFHAFVSNPPYVTNSEKHLIQPNVLNYEPHTALFVPDDDPLIFYRSIVKLAQKKLIKNGMLAFEINEKFGGEVRNLLTNTGFNQVEVLKDINGKDRFVTGLR